MGQWRNAKVEAHGNFKNVGGKKIVQIMLFQIFIWKIICTSPPSNLDPTIFNMFIINNLSSNWEIKRRKV